MQNPDMSQYLGVFLDEAKDQLGLLESEILKMERGDHSKEILQSLFRAAHTLKGSSRSMGFMEIGNLTHEMENVLDDLRNGVLSVIPSIIDALLRCSDSLTTLIGLVSAEGTDTDAPVQEVSDLILHLSQLRSGASAVPSEKLDERLSVVELGENGQDALLDGLAAGKKVLRIDGIVDPSCPMKGVRVFMAFSVLERYGEVLASVPAEPSLDDTTDIGRFMVLLATENLPEDVLAALREVADLQDLTAEPIWGDREFCEEENVAEGDEPVLTENTCFSDAAEPNDLKPPAPVLQIVTSPAPKRVSDPNAPPLSPTIRVDVARLDALLNLVGELVTDRTQVTRLAGEIHKRHADDEAISDLNDTLGRISRITSELQNEVMKTRMLPIDGVFQRMPRMVRDIALKVGKDIELTVQGGESELDRSVLEFLPDPLIHILRNSVDHAIEPPEERKAVGKPTKGQISMCARYQESQVVIEIIDDGRGIDPQKIRTAAMKKGIITESEAANLSDKESLNLIMASGFTTAATLSDLSGRGVGMDIVKSNLDKIGGKLSIESKVGVGTKVIIQLPLTLAIARALLVRADNQTFIFPLSIVLEMLYLGGIKNEITQTTVGKDAMIILRGQTVPLIGLADMLAGDPRSTSAQRIGKNAHVIITRHRDNLVGICIDSVAGEQEVVIKGLGPLLGDIPGISGASILGDGKVALIVDVSRAIDEMSRTDLRRFDYDSQQLDRMHVDQSGATGRQLVEI